MINCCPECGKAVQILEHGKNLITIGCPDHRQHDKTVYLDSIFVLCEDDVFSLAEQKKIEIPKEKRDDVIYYVKKYVSSYCFDGAYTVWDAIEDAIKEALEG